ncbi:MAG: FecCD family ABC transporter permease [Solirubrobacteraceae bacterium]
MLASLLLGSGPVGPGAALRALLHPGDHPDDYGMLRELRVPRTATGIVVGAALGACGVLLQAVTRNPVADPGILGISAGASLAVVLGITLFGASGSAAYAPFALLGGTVAGAVAWFLAGGERGGVVGLALAGAALAALCGALTQALTVLDAATLDRFRFWLVGSVAGGDLSTLAGAAPALGLGALGAVLVAPALTTLALGDDVARGLGQRVGPVRLGAALAALLLAAGAVAVAGPIALVALLAAHSARRLVGPGVPLQLLVAALLGVAVLVGGDLAGRLVVPARELAVGVVSPLIGAPLFVWLVTRGRTAT